MTDRVLIITVGLPGSGKTTWARKCAQVNDGIRVNRDDFRAMTRGGWTGDQDHEDQITAMTHAAIAAAWRAGVGLVIADDTNLGPLVQGKLMRLARRCGARFEVQDFRGVPLSTCLERNALRAPDQQVPESAILAMYQRWIGADADVR